MSTPSRRRFVTTTLAAGAAAFSAGPTRVLASTSRPDLQGRAKEKMNFVVEAGNIGLVYHAVGSCARDRTEVDAFLLCQAPGGRRGEHKSNRHGSGSRGSRLNSPGETHT